jgi:pilus assembly protein Flp/PilA
MKRRVIKLFSDSRGATAIEYGLIVALIVIAIIGGMSTLGGASGSMWGNISTKVDSALTS